MSKTANEIMWTCGQCGKRITSETDRVFGETVGVFHRACRNTWPRPPGFTGYTSTIPAPGALFDPTALADDNAVMRFCQAMSDKMATSRAKGRGGWQTCSVDALWKMLREHVEKGDPVDVANFAMMIWCNANGGAVNV